METFGQLRFELELWHRFRCDIIQGQTKSADDISPQIGSEGFVDICHAIILLCKQNTQTAL